MKFTRDNINVQPINVPVTTHQEVYLGNGFKMLLNFMLFQASGAPLKVTAIKAVRAELGCGLKEAKDIVDALTPAMLGYVAQTQPIESYVGTLGDMLAKSIRDPKNY